MTAAAPQQSQSVKGAGVIVLVILFFIGWIRYSQNRNDGFAILTAAPIVSNAVQRPPPTPPRAPSSGETDWLKFEVGHPESPVIKYEEGRATQSDMCKLVKYPVPSKPVTSGKGKKVLVTGAAGFIASHVAKACADLGMDVIAVDDLSGGFTENVPQMPNVKFVKLDIKDGAAVEAVFAEHGPFEYVYHLAAYAAEGMSHFIRSYNYRNNLVGSMEVLNSAVRHNTRCFIFTSSIAAYGAATPPILETTPMSPEDPYGIAKYAMELDLRAAHEMFGIDFIIFRPHNVYGPHQNIADRYRNVIGIFMNQILNKKPMTIFGDGLQTRAFSYIDDVAPIIAKAPLIPEARNQQFNIGAEKPWNLNDLADYVGRSMGYAKYEVKHLDKRFEVQNAEATHCKLKCFFNPGKPVSLEVGLNRTAEWVRARTKGFKPVEFMAVEVKKKMPPSWVRPDLQETTFLVFTAGNNTNVIERQQQQPNKPSP